MVRVFGCLLPVIFKMLAEVTIKECSKMTNKGGGSFLSTNKGKK